jgi:hypothetical protein
MLITTYQKISGTIYIRTFFSSPPARKIKSISLYSTRFTGIIPILDVLSIRFLGWHLELKLHNGTFSFASPHIEYSCFLGMFISSHSDSSLSSADSSVKINHFPTCSSTLAWICFISFPLFASRISSSS